MAKRQNPLKRIRLVFQRTSPKIKILIIAMLVVCTVTLLALSIALSRSQKNLEAKRQEAIALEQENAELTEDINQLGTVKSIKDLAKKFWHLVDPDAVIFSPE